MARIPFPVLLQNKDDLKNDNGNIWSDILYLERQRRQRLGNKTGQVRNWLEQSTIEWVLMSERESSVDYDSSSIDPSVGTEDQFSIIR